jgi:hypothetical protein
MEVAHSGYWNEALLLNHLVLVSENQFSINTAYSSLSGIGFE